MPALLEGRRVLFGLASLPASIPAEDPRLPGVVLQALPLRLNTHKLAARVDGHAARWQALHALLHRGCGDYGGRQRGWVDAYLVWVAARLDAARHLLAAGFDRFDGLYAAEDWAWSALRPLPRAWVPTGQGHVAVGLAFWTGATLLASEPPSLPGVTPLDGTCPWDHPAFARFWEGQILPTTPFGPALPHTLPDAPNR